MRDVHHGVSRVTVIWITLVRAPLNVTMILAIGLPGLLPVVIYPVGRHGGEQVVGLGEPIEETGFLHLHTYQSIRAMKLLNCLIKMVMFLTMTLVIVSIVRCGGGKGVWKGVLALDP